jgi:hypothetical protein
MSLDAERGHHPFHARAQAAAARAVELRQQSERVLAKARAVQQIIVDAQREQWSSPAGRERLQRSEYARLLARLETMPVIEQAKGIIMAQSRCGEAEAFDMLRRASQRSNVPVRDLAARIVAKAAGTAPIHGKENVRALHRSA